MSWKPTSIGALVYILATKLIYSERSFFLVDAVRNAARNDTTPFDFMNYLMLKLRQVHSMHGWRLQNVVLCSLFCAARHELSEGKIPDGTSLLSIKAWVRNENSTVVKVFCAGLLHEYYRTLARYKPRRVDINVYRLSTITKKRRGILS